MPIFSSYKKMFLLGAIVIILVAIPFSVYIAQKRQNISSKAAPSTVLSFEPASSTVETGDTFTLNIILDPGAGNPPNQVSFVKLSINFDPTKFTTVSDSLEPNAIGNALREKIDEPQYDNTAGKASISLSIGADPANALKTKTKIAMLKLKATDTTNPTSPNITFDPDPDTQVLSIASSDQTSENVLSSTTIPATVTVASAANITPTPSANPTTSPSADPSANPFSPTLAPAQGGGISSSLAPVCSSLEVNGSTSGTAPYPLTFTATGSDSDGTISKISFNFGDSIEELTEGYGIGTNLVSGQIFHTYETPGIYTAYAILTDNSNNLSIQQAGCTKTITINSADQGGFSQSNPTLPPTGDGTIMIGLGALGVIFMIIGGALLLL